MKQALILLLFLPIFSFGQSKFSFGINAGVKAGIMNIEEETLNRSITQNSKLKAGYSVGIDLKYDISSRLFVRSGLLYENSRYAFETEGLTFGACFDPVTFEARETRIFETPSIKTIGIPLDLGYVFSDAENMKLFFGGGFQYNFVLDAEIVTSSQKEGEGTVEGTSEDGVNPSNYALKIFLGAEFSLTPKMNLAVEPTLKFIQNEFEFFSLAKTSSSIEPGVVVRVSF